MTRVSFSIEIWLQETQFLGKYKLRRKSFKQDESLEGRVDLGNSSQVIIFSAQFLGPSQIVQSKPSALNQEREDKQ